jgi:hypothetical protein
VMPVDHTRRNKLYQIVDQLTRQDREAVVSNRSVARLIREEKDVLISFLLFHRART